MAEWLTESVSQSVTDQKVNIAVVKIVKFYQNSICHMTNVYQLPNADGGIICSHAKFKISKKLNL